MEVVNTKRESLICACLVVVSVILVTRVVIIFAMSLSEIRRIFGTTVGRDRSVGIATRCGLDGPGIESRWERDFPHPFRPVPMPTHLPVQWVPELFPGEGG